MTTTALNDFIITLRGWSTFDSLTDEVVTSFIRMAEERINTELRCREMVVDATPVIAGNAITIPDDFLEIEYIRFLGAGNDYIDTLRGHPLTAVTRDEYWRSVHVGDGDLRSKYTVIGNKILLSPRLTDGVTVSMAYYGRLPPLANDAGNWLYNKYQSLYLFSSLAFMSAYSQEEEKGMMWEQQTASMIGTLNANNKTSQYGQSSRLRPNRRSFG